MKNITKRFFNNLINIPILKIIPIIVTHLLLTQYIESNLIYTLLVVVPLNTGCSYMFYKALSNKEVSIKGMFDGYKFCRKTQIVSIFTYIFSELFMLLILNISTNTITVIQQILLLLHATILYILNYKLSYMRYYSMEGFCGAEEKLNFKNTIKGALYTGKGTFLIYIVFKIIFAFVGVVSYFALLNSLHSINRTIFSFIYLIFARLLDELIRLSIYEYKKTRKVEKNNS